MKSPGTKRRTERIRTWAAPVTIAALRAQDATLVKTSRRTGFTAAPFCGLLKEIVASKLRAKVYYFP